MKNIVFIWAILAAVLLFNTSCNESTILGSELFDKENLDLKFHDSLTINALSETFDSVKAYPLINSQTGGPSNNLYLPLGKMIDPTFGTVEARIYTELDSSVAYNFADKTIDSVIFVLGYNKTGVYGDTSQTQRLSLYRLTEVISGSTDAYTNKQYATEATALSTVQFKPQPNTFVNIGKGLTALLDTAPQIRFSITNPTFINQLKDTSLYQSKNGFRNWLKGFEIRPENETNCMLRCNLLTPM
jgi:hypothetical protein